MGCGVAVEQIQIVERIRIFNSACGLLHLNRSSFLLSIIVVELRYVCGGDEYLPTRNGDGGGWGVGTHANVFEAIVAEPRQSSPSLRFRRFVLLEHTGTFDFPPPRLAAFEG